MTAATCRASILWNCGWSSTWPGIRTPRWNRYYATAARSGEVYRWLFRTHSKFGQDNRIRTLLEQDAFVRIAQRWHRLGYPSMR